MFFIIQDFEQLSLALKNRVALEFFTVLKYFLSFRIFEQLALALKTEFALKFFKPGGAAGPPDPPPRTPMTILFLSNCTFLPCHRRQSLPSVLRTACTFISVFVLSTHVHSFQCLFSPVKLSISS